MIGFSYGNSQNPGFLRSRACITGSDDIAGIHRRIAQILGPRLVRRRIECGILPGRNPQNVPPLCVIFKIVPGTIGIACGLLSSVTARIAGVRIIAVGCFALGAVRSVDHFHNTGSESKILKGAAVPCRHLSVGSLPDTGNGFAGSGTVPYRTLRFHHQIVRSLH